MEDDNTPRRRASPDHGDRRGGLVLERDRVAAVLAVVGAGATIAGLLLPYYEVAAARIQSNGASTYFYTVPEDWSLWRFTRVYDVLFTAAASFVVVFALPRLVGRGGQRGTVALAAAAGATLALLVTFYSPAETLVHGHRLPAGAVTALAGAAALAVALALVVLGVRHVTLDSRSATTGRALLGVAALTAPSVNVVSLIHGTSFYEATRVADLAVLVAAIALAATVVLMVRRRVLALLAVALGAFCCAASLGNGLELLVADHVNHIGAGAWLQVLLVTPLTLVGTTLLATALSRDQRSPIKPTTNPEPTIG